MALIASLRGLSVVHDGRTVLGPLDFDVESSSRWIVLGPNGSGKTSLVRALSLQTHPSTGTVEVLGERWGHTDVRELRKRIGLASAALREQLRPQLRAVDVVVTAKNAALEPWWHRYDDADYAHAVGCLDQLGMGGFAERQIETLSSGEQQRVLLARTLMTEPGLVILDEPASGLDLTGREQLVTALSGLARSTDSTPMVLVTHHPDEIPPGFNQLLLLREGMPVYSGPLEEGMQDDLLSATFGLALKVERRRDRYLAFAS
ncbi:MAG: ATP-binding cassette domain-containing protein [Actinobacteria bacterium]|nr:ATP-binding cassette domain-containing protein [Actinomycetota bacterium]